MSWKSWLDLEVKPISTTTHHKTSLWMQMAVLSDFFHKNFDYFEHEVHVSKNFKQVEYLVFIFFHIFLSFFRFFT